MKTKKMYRIAYSTGGLFLILSMLLSIFPANFVAAEPGGSGSTNTSNVSCGQSPVNQNSYEIGEHIYLHFKGYEPNSTLTWDITGVSGCDKNVSVASGTYQVDGDGDGCVLAYTPVVGNCGVYQQKTNGTKGDNFSIDGGEEPPPNLGVAVSKSANPTSVTAPGGQVSYTVTVTNQSEVAMELTDLTDNKFGDLNGQGNCSTGDVLAVDETYECSFIGTVNGNPGDTHTNIVSATIASSYGDASDNSSARVDIVSGPPDPELSVLVQKSADPTEIQEPGGNVTFSVEVTNQSTEDATLTSLTDDQFGDLNGQGTCETGGTILAGDTYSCSFSGLVEGDAGDTHTNIVSATISNENDSDSDSDSANVSLIATPPPPDLTIEVTKSANPNSIKEPGGDSTFTVDIENTSEISLTITSITDNLFGDLNGVGDCVVGETIGPGETYSCSFVKEVSGDSENEHQNTVTAVAKDDQDNTATDSDSATITFFSEGSNDISLIDPCSVDCDQENVSGQLCNNNLTEDYEGSIFWEVFVDDTSLGTGTIEGVPAGECINLSVGQGGDGLYSVVATLSDEDNRTITTECGPLVCEEPPSGPPPGGPPPQNPPTTPPVFIPVTGADFGSTSLVRMLQNLGFALLSLGLVIHGFSLGERRKRD